MLSNSFQYCKYWKELESIGAEKPHPGSRVYNFRGAVKGEDGTDAQSRRKMSRV